MAAQPKVIQIGVPMTMANGIVYATPIKACSFAVGTTNPNMQTNIVNSTTGWVSLSLTTGQFTTTSPFLKTTETTVTILAKAL